MDLPIYTPKTTAELLGIPSKALRSALDQERYSAKDLWALRKALRIHPRPIGHRKQLFLNFKGGTGKLKGLTGKGTCKGTFNADGTSSWDIQGDYKIP